MVCLEERPGAEFVVLHGCYHAFCSECLHDFLTLHIAEGSIAQIKCPQMDCQKPIPQHCVQALASPTQYARFEQLQLQQSLQAMPDVFWCPRCNGPAIKEGDDLAECAACVFAFCVLCGSGWHPGVKCMSAADRVLYLAKRAASGGFSAEQSMEARRKHADALSQAESEKLISHSSKKCPGCGFGIERTSGCNKMHCVVCDCSFCWLCLQVVEGYGHFRGDLGNSKCAGRLFQGTEMDEYANQPMPVPGRQQLLQQEIRFQKCPRCKQNNVKEDKANHLKCWNCRCRFCYLCRVVCQGTSHFSRGGCPQHSDD